MAKRETSSQASRTICESKPKFRERNTQTSYACKEFQNFTSLHKEQYVLRKTVNCENQDWNSESKYVRIMAGHTKCSEVGNNNHKYFRKAVTLSVTPEAEIPETPSRYGHNILKDIVRSAQRRCYDFPAKPEPCKTVGIQTDYRDSEAQTLPWEPPYKVRPGHNPETLTIAHLTWNHGLPAGVHEIEIINRMRMKRAWGEILPPMDTPSNIKLRTSIITALEVDEWAFRESEIQAIMDYRLQLMEEISQSRKKQQEKSTEARFGRLSERLSKRRDKEIDSIRHTLKRDLRKLRRRHQPKSLKRDIIREHADPASELYAPLMRHGENAGRRHEVIRKEMLKEDYIECTEYIDTMPDWVPTYEELKAVKPKPKPTDLCIRETRWTEEKLRQLHSDLKAIRLNLKPVETLSLMKRKYKPPPLPLTPHRSNEEDPETVEIDQHSVLMQKIIRGRAVQCMMSEGRERCRELIEELQSTQALDPQNQKQRYKEKMHMIELQRLQNDRATEEDRFCEVLNSLEGKTVVGMLDFLSKELIRLEDERRVHAFALLAERERWMREAAELGRRQLERNRRREFDEMFRQMVKLNQESVEAYLEDIIKDGIEWVSEEAAKQYILDIADKADAVAKYAMENNTELEQEEMIADMIYNFVLPEVEKQNVRRSIREKERSYMQNAHAAIYETILDLPPVEELRLSDEKNDVCFSTGIAEQECYTAEDTPEKEEQSIGIESSIEPIISDSEDIVRDLLESIVWEVIEHEDLFDTAE